MSSASMGMWGTEESWVGGRRSKGRSYFAEIHRLDAFAAQRGAHRRRRGRLAGADDELHNLLPCWRTACHVDGP